MTPWADIVGAAHVAPGRPDDAVDGVVPAWVVRPGTVREVRTCVHAAAATGTALVVRGLGGHLGLGAPPRRLDVLLALDRMGRVLDHQAADMTVTVEAGCPLPVLAAVLASAGQWLPVDPPRPEATSVGGIVAADLSGPLRASQGRVRDLLIGVRTVGADGALVAGGGRVVKNVAGYDLPKLHVGALGTVGVIVEATFRLRPRPDREEAVIIACRTVERAAETALAVASDGVGPLWLELAGPGGLAEGPGEGAAVVVGLAGIPDEVADGRERTLETARAHGLRAIGVADGAGLRMRLADFPVEPAAAVLRAAVLPTEVGESIAAITARARRAGADARCLAHAMNGVIHVAVPSAGAVASLVMDVRRRLEARGGSLVIERASPELKAEIDVWGDPGPGLALMRRVKETFDPQGLLAPGRFVGGL